MFGFLKRLFGRDDYDDKIVKSMMNFGRRFEIDGVEIAQDCYQNGLLQGKTVRLSDITNFIKQNYNPTFCGLVEAGFLKQMISYVEQGVVINFNI